MTTQQLTPAVPGLFGQVSQLQFLADYLPEPKRGPFLGRLKSYSSLGATQRQVMAEYIFDQLALVGKQEEANKAWAKAQAEGARLPVVEQTASIARLQVMRAEAALKAASKINKLHKLVTALAQLAAKADCASVDELVQLSNEQLAIYVGQLANDDYATLAPFLSLPKRG